MNKAENVIETLRQDESFSGCDIRQDEEGNVSVRIDSEVCARIGAHEIQERTPEDIVKLLSSGLGLVRQGNRNCCDFEAVKDALEVRAFPALEEGVSNCVRMRLGDIALVLYAQVAKNEMCRCGFNVPSVMARAWGVSRAELIDMALENSARVAPAVVKELDTEANAIKTARLQDANWDNAGFIGVCVTTERPVGGAVAMFYPGVPETIASKLGGDFYIAFTSRHEAMVHPAKVTNPRDIKTCLRFTLRHVTAKCDYLSDHVFWYHSKSGSFTVAC